MQNQLYPLKFSPILKDKIWGGTKLIDFYQKTSKSDKLGESWELSGYKGEESIVLNGFLAGKTLQELIDTYSEKLIGDKVLTNFGPSFPLLFKLIDANENLSIQVHPDDSIAQMRHNSFGKTEMWYVLEADKDAELIIGFAEACTREHYLSALQTGQIENLLQKVKVSAGDVFYIPAGLVHAIGKGVVVAEIQQSSDVTYRIYDYKRKDIDGNERELHTDQALDVINYSITKDPKTKYNALLNQATSLVKCDYFTTNIIRFNQKINRKYAHIDSFIVFMCIVGSFRISCNGAITLVKTGETILIPASIKDIVLTPDDETLLLEVYIS